MRCPKCKWIIAEYNLVCPQCGENLTELREELGPFYEPKPEVFPESFLEPEKPEEPPVFEVDQKEGITIPEFTSEAPSEPRSEAFSEFSSETGEEAPVTETSELEIPFSEELFIEEIPETSETKAEEEAPILEGLDLKELDLEELASKEESKEAEKEAKKGIEKEKVLEEMPDIDELLPPELKEEEKK